MDKRQACLEYMREYRREARHRNPQKAHLDNRRAYEKKTRKVVKNDGRRVKRVQGTARGVYERVQKEKET